MKNYEELMESRSTAIILVMAMALPLSIIIGTLRDFHSGYITYCCQAVLLCTWYTLHDGGPKIKLYLGLICMAAIHVVAITIFGERLRSFSSFAITLIFIADFVATSWIVGSLLRFDDEHGLSMKSQGRNARQDGRAR